jgi:hypothetical protein
MEFAHDGTNNMVDTPLASELMSLLGSQKSNDGRNNDVQNESTKTGRDVDIASEKAKQKARIAFRELELLLGTFSGLSGVDVIVIVEALFTITTDQLIGLLNDEAKSRLKALRQVTSNTNVDDSLQALETKVQEIFTRIMGGASSRKHKNKLSNKKE